jgi:hypothetical protein
MEYASQGGGGGRGRIHNGRFLAKIPLTDFPHKFFLLYFFILVLYFK